MEVQLGRNFASILRICGPMPYSRAEKVGKFSPNDVEYRYMAAGVTWSIWTCLGHRMAIWGGNLQNLMVERNHTRIFITRNRTTEICMAKASRLCLSFTMRRRLTWVEISREKNCRFSDSCFGCYLPFLFPFNSKTLNVSLPGSHIGQLTLQTLQQRRAFSLKLLICPSSTLWTKGWNRDSIAYVFEIFRIRQFLPVLPDGFRFK